MEQPSYAVMDEALVMLSAYGPDLKNGLTNHAPMAIEALCALGRSDVVMPWLEEYRTGILPRPPGRERIKEQTWREALGQCDRTTDWAEFFRAELQQAPWRDVLQRWVRRLAPGLCGSATHGVIRVSHAVRSLHMGESPERLLELADGLGYMAATYQELPTAMGSASHGLNPSEAISSVNVVPPGQRRFRGTITSSLAALSDFPPFAAVVGLVGVTGDTSRILSNLTETFARVYLANARDVLTTIVFIHGVTSAAALRSLVAHLDGATTADVLRFGWQAGCGLYAAFGTRPAPATAIEPPRESQATLIDMAVAHGDEHAIKFTEACLREYALNPAPAYLAAARHALNMLPPRAA